MKNGGDVPHFKKMREQAPPLLTRSTATELDMLVVYLIDTVFCICTYRYPQE